MKTGQHQTTHSLHAKFPQPGEVSRWVLPGYRVQHAATKNLPG